MNTRPLGSGQHHLQTPIAFSVGVLATAQPFTTAVPQDLGAKAQASAPLTTPHLSAKSLRRAPHQECKSLGLVLADTDGHAHCRSIPLPPRGLWNFSETPILPNGDFPAPKALLPLAKNPA